MHVHVKSRDDVTGAERKPALRHRGSLQRLWPWKTLAVVAGARAWAGTRPTPDTAALICASSQSQLLAFITFWNSSHMLVILGTRILNLHDRSTCPTLFNSSFLFLCFWHLPSTENGFYKIWQSLSFPTFSWIFTN